MTESAPWVEGLTIGQVLQQTAERNSAGDALVCPQSSVRLSWSELAAQANQVAKGLLAIGFQAGDHLGVWATNWPEWVILQFAVARIGVVLVTVNPSYRPSELEYALAQSEIRGLALIDGYKKLDYFQMLEEVCPELANSVPGTLRSPRFPKLEWVIRMRGRHHPALLDWQQLLAAGQKVPTARLEDVATQLSPGDPINLQYTSGTTGHPKGALLTHRNLLLNGYYAGQRQNLAERDRICIPEIGRAVQQECRDRSRMPSSA
eukprot:TRINITY_DN715_c0_g1_i2.p2 TRINITY_DN715_c0_g1~~TRINITY_DN715_c0_g1_i2.p2  ORF type:complete len:262 (+),score=60.50 TRINITY_DN715_c0_g1_i2:1332-2117(+)